VSFELLGGEIHALLGANGAGKSTLCNIISGLTPATSGRMMLAEQGFAPRNKQAAEHCGVQIVQQELSLFPTLTVAENLFFGRFVNLGGIIRRRQLAKLARIALDRVGLNDVAGDTPLKSLGVGKQQMVEIATALDRDCRVLILDEPTAALSAHETATLFDWLRRLRRQGVGIIYISHRLDEVTEISDRISILRDGKNVGTHATADLSTDQMVAMMSGDDEAHGAMRDHHNHSRQQVRLRAEGLTRLPSVNNVSFDLRAGQRLGVAGLVGSGRTELLRAIFGADVASRGTVTVEAGTATRFQHPGQAVQAGFAMVTEDRKQDGLLLTQPVTENTTLSSLHRFKNRIGVCKMASERDAAQRIHEDLETRCTSVDQLVGTLSGGNQQKVAVAKWLLRDAKVFLFDEPTRGIDVGARRRLYRLFDSLAEQGKSMIIVSSDIDELLETCDRIIVISAGKVSGEFTREDWNRESILQACFSGYRETASQ
jgi:ribose transport system ATP-binding protein